MENKFGKYLTYAIGEIILVVIGILIALQINNSNNKRIEKEREFKYLTNIKLDLIEDIENLEYNIDFRQKKILGIEKLIKQINGQPIKDLNETTYNVINTLYQERFQPSNVTYSDLVNSGNMNLISNDSIKIYLFELSLLYQQNIFNIEHETAEYDENISKSIFKFADIERMKPVFLGKKTIEQVNITEKDFKALFESLEYKNGCVVAKWTSEAMIELYQNIKNKSEYIIELINTELKKKTKSKIRRSQSTTMAIRNCSFSPTAENLLIHSSHSVLVSAWCVPPRRISANPRNYSEPPPL